MLQASVSDTLTKVTSIGASPYILFVCKIVKYTTTAILCLIFVNFYFHVVTQGHSASGVDVRSEVRLVNL